MCSLQFDFLDFSDIGEEDYQSLVNILEEKKPEVFLSSAESSPVKETKEGEEDENEDKIEIKSEEDEDYFISQARKDDSTSGISFFVDGGTAEDIDPEKTPPMLSASVTPPPSDSPSTLCNDQDDMPPDEEPVNMYPHIPPPQYINHPPPMMQHMNVHNVPTSASVYNMPTYPTHSGPGAVHNTMYQHIPHNHGHQLVPHTVHIENCHVNLSPYGNPQPQHPPGALYAAPPPPQMQTQYQMAAHPQVYQQYLTEQQPQMSMPMKANMDKEFDHKRHDPHNRGSYRGRGRGRGRRRGGREDHERSNSVSSDHSSYSDSGSKNHYKDNPATPTLPQSHPYPHLMPQYQTYIPYTMNTIPRSHSHQGYPLIPSFIHNPYASEQAHHHVLAYPPQPPPVSVALIPNDSANHPEYIVTSDSANHPEYIVTTSYEGAAPLETGCHYSYPSGEPTNVEIVTQEVAMSPSEYNQSNANINMMVTCSSNTIVMREDCNEQTCNDNMDPQIEYIESKISSVQFEVDNISVDSVMSVGSPVEGATIEEVETNETIISSYEAQNVLKVEEPPKSIISNGKSKSPNNEKSVKNQDKSQPKTQNNQKSQSKPIPPVVNNIPVSLESSTPVIYPQKNSHLPSGTLKNKENGVLTKSKRKNSLQNKETLSIKSTSPELIPSDPLSEISFGLDNSITVYNKSLAPIIHTKEFTKSSKIEESVKQEDTIIIHPTQPTKVGSTNMVLEKAPPVPYVNSSRKVGPVESEPIPPKTEVELPPLESSFTPSVQQPAVPDAWGQTKIWSQLFKNNEEFSTKQIAFVSPFNAKENDSASVKVALGKENGDINYSDSEIEKVKVGSQIKKFTPDYRPVLLQPRGLINKNYWCYVNAPLQALLACPSFYQLAKSLSKDAGKNSGNMATPFINSIVDFASEFTPMSPFTKGRKEKGVKKEPEILHGAPFEPTCVYKMLCKTNQFTEGRQQDAEEMLSCILNGLHDEMVESLKLAGGLDTVQNGVQNGTELNITEEGNEWKVQGPKKKSYVTRVSHYNLSPISEIFWGQWRCVLHHAGGNTTANLQPFNTLPLDIQSPNVETLQDALNQLVTREEISGFTCPKTNQEVTASNQMMFEDLPRVLTVQLKRFIYDKGGLQKVTKKLEFTIDLEIKKDLISPNSRSKFSPSQRKYKLFGIVHHEGKEATKGHYVSDIFYNGHNCWLRYDDSNVKLIPEAVIFKHEPPRVPYLLFYRRMDTFAPPQPQHNGSGSSSTSSNCNGK